jgi:hypothetical protein
MERYCVPARAERGLGAISPFWLGTSALSSWQNETTRAGFITSVKVGSGGSTRDLLNILDTIAKAGAGFKSLTDTWADTTTAHGRLMLTVLGGLAEFERELILARTGDGRRRAKARGVRFDGRRL